jgi:hypothetical protein
VPPEKFGKIMASVAQRMRAEFDQTAAMRHRPGKGATREEIVREFIAKYLPGQADVTGRGEIITADEQVSGECDIMIVDRSTPPFTDYRDFRVVPAECVHGVVEVKSFLDGRELLGACEKIEAVKSLPKTAYGPPPDGNLRRAPFYGQVYDYTPTAGLIFAFDSISLEELGRQFADWCNGKHPSLVPDSVWVLGKGQLLWAARENRDLKARADPDADLVVIRADPDQGNLLPLAIQLSILISYAWMPPLALQDYASHGSDGAEIARYRPGRQ